MTCRGPHDMMESLSHLAPYPEGGKGGHATSGPFLPETQGSFAFLPHPWFTHELAQEKAVYAHSRGEGGA